MSLIEIIPESIQMLKMSDEEYFSEKYKDYISNSKLGLINPEQNGSPELYKTGFPSKYSESFEFGSAVHSMLLQPEYFNISPIKKPSAKLGYCADKIYEFLEQGLPLEKALVEGSKKADYYSKNLTENRKEAILKSCSEYWEKRKQYEIEFFKNPENKDKQIIYLSSALNDKFEKCMSNIPKSFNDILKTGESYNEYAIFCEVLVDGKLIKLKAKIDNFTIDHDNKIVTLNDLKTTGKPVSYFMGNFVKSEHFSDEIWYDGSFQKYNYYRQMGLYLWLLNAAIMRIYSTNYKCTANMLVIESTPEYRSKIYPVKKDYITQGLNEFKYLIKLVIENE